MLHRVMIPLLSQLQDCGEHNGHIHSVLLKKVEKVVIPRDVQKRDQVVKPRVTQKRRKVVIPRDVQNRGGELVKPRAVQKGWTVAIPRDYQKRGQVVIPQVAQKRGSSYIQDCPEKGKWLNPGMPRRGTNEWLGWVCSPGTRDPRLVLRHDMAHDSVSAFQPTPVTTPRIKKKNPGSTPDHVDKRCNLPLGSLNQEITEAIHLETLHRDPATMDALWASGGKGGEKIATTWAQTRLKEIWVCNALVCALNDVTSSASLCLSLSDATLKSIYIELDYGSMDRDKSKDGNSKTMVSQVSIALSPMMKSEELSEVFDDNL
uniref:Uncharacterized protein n=1 Tax=Timema douglasi TaxID=61478 RepID=A0A7R8ZBP9_TIMDO|nr:unnamed protein product [Timema douglasi]